MHIVKGKVRPLRNKILVKSIKEQSSILINNQDVIIIFPGGTGTIHELFYRTKSYLRQDNNFLKTVTPPVSKNMTQN